MGACACLSLQCLSKGRDGPNGVSRACTYKPSRDPRRPLALQYALDHPVFQLGDSHTTRPAMSADSLQRSTMLTYSTLQEAFGISKYEILRKSDLTSEPRWLPEVMVDMLTQVKFYQARPGWRLSQYDDLENYYVPAVSHILSKPIRNTDP